MRSLVILTHQHESTCNHNRFCLCYGPSDRLKERVAPRDFTCEKLHDFLFWQVPSANARICFSNFPPSVLTHISPPIPSLLGLVLSFPYSHLGRAKKSLGDGEKHVNSWCLLRDSHNLQMGRYLLRESHNSYVVFHSNKH